MVEPAGNEVERNSSPLLLTVNEEENQVVHEEPASIWGQPHLPVGQGCKADKCRRQNR